MCAKLIAAPARSCTAAVRALKYRHPTFPASLIDVIIAVAWGPTRLNVPRFPI